TNIIPEYISILKERFSGENLHYYYEAKYKYSEGELDAAIKLFHASIEKKPNFSPAYIMLSFVYAECLKDYDNAIKFGEIANNKFRANVAIVNNLAYAYLMKNEVSKAGSVLQEVLENKNKNFCLIATIGLLRIKEGDIQEGSSLYNLASKIAPTEYFKKVVLQKKNLELAKYYLDNGDERRAKELLIKAVSMKQSDTFYYEDAKELLSKID
ncbi:MAG: hypothetical protein KJ736_09600, partial [Candidatus Omnitrophica bacterium]|nr:hypothetical protein [Candidatus Omnitrophota bacterium]